MRLLDNTQNNRSLWGIGVIAFCWTTSSMMVFSILAPFLRYEFQASYQDIGNLEGLANAASFAAKFLSGILSDVLRSRTGILAFGSLFTAICKVLFALASSLMLINIARILDRLSKGIRAAPADAILSDLSHQSQRGLAYGLRQTFMTLGAVFGTLCTLWILSVYPRNYRLVMYLATFPAMMSLVIQWWMVRQPNVTPKDVSTKNSTFSFKHFWVEYRQLPIHFWFVLCIFNILMFARFSENFVVLRAMELGWPEYALPLVLGIMNAVHAILAFPIGRIADRIGHGRVVHLGLCILIAANLCIIYAPSYHWLYLAIVLIGIELSMTQGVMKAIISRIIPWHLRGTGFALIAITTSFSLFYSNKLAGYLAHTYNNTAMSFWGGLISATFTLVLMRFCIKEI